MLTTTTPTTAPNSSLIFSQLYADDPTLTSLDLSGALLNVGGDTGLSTISDALNCSTHLRELILSDNNISDTGVILLADTLSDPRAATGLHSVVLDGNAVGTEGVFALVMAMRRTSKTIFISLERNRAEVDSAALYQLNTMVRLNDQPGKLRQVILDLIAENDATSALERRQYVQRRAKIEAAAAADDGTMVVAKAAAAASPPTSGAGGEMIVADRVVGNSNNNKSSEQQQQTTTKMASSMVTTTTTRTLELDLSNAYARWPPPDNSDLFRGTGKHSPSSKQQQQQQDTSNISYTDLFHQFLDILCHTLSQNSVLLKLSLAGNFITDAGARSLGNMLRQNRHLDELCLDTNSITDDGAMELISALDSNNTLCIMSLLRNSISPDVFFKVEVAQALNRQPLSLKKYYNDLVADVHDQLAVPKALVFDNRGSERRYDDVGIRMMCVALENNTHVEALTIVDAEITDLGCICLRDLYRKNTHLRALHLKKCQMIGVDGVGRLCDLLSVSTTLESLTVSDCDIDDDAALLIASAVEQHPSLTELDVSFNKDIISSAQAIATAFAHNYRLKHVNVDGTSCTESVKTAVSVRQMASSQPERLRSLFGFLISNSFELRSVELRPTKMEDTLLDDSAIEMLSQALIDNTKVTHLDVSGNAMTLAGAKEVYRMLRLNRSTLRTLNMSDNRIDFGLQHAKLVAAVLGLHTVLHAVDISNTGMDDSGVEFIFGEVETYSNRIPVRSIDVSRNRQVTPQAESRLQLMLRAHACHPVVKRRFRTVHREWFLSNHKSLFRNLKLGHVFDHAADYFDIAPPTEEDRIQVVAIAMDFLKEHAYKTVTTLDVSGNMCTDAGIKHVSDYVIWAAKRHDVPIETVNAAENALSDTGIDYLCKAAIACESIRSILAAGNGSALGGTVTEPALAELHARVSFNLQPEEMRRLIRAAEEGTVGEGMSTAGDIDESSRSIHHVNDTHVDLLVRALSRKNAADVYSVNFSNNYVSLAGLNALVELAVQRPCLKKIILRNTMIRGVTAEESQRLQDNLLQTELTHVDLSDNEFANEFAEAVLPSLRQSKTLIFFSMNGSGLDPAVELAVASSVSLNALNSGLAAAGVLGRLGLAGHGDDDDDDDDESTDVDEDELLQKHDELLKGKTAGTGRLFTANTTVTTNNKQQERKQRRQHRRRGNNKHAPEASDIFNNKDIFDDTTLNLARASLDERQLAEIVRMSRQKGNITSIDLSHDKLVDESLAQIVLLVVGMPTLHHLNIASNTVGNATVTSLCHVVVDPQCDLRTLDLSDAISPRLRPGALMEFFDMAFEQSSSLWKVVTTNCEECLTPEDEAAIRRLRLNRQLELKKILPRILADDATLSDVNAMADDDHNVIDDIGLRLLCEALAVNTHVHNVNLRITEVAEAGVRFLEPVVASTALIESLSLVGSRVLKEGRCFADLIKIAKGLKRLDIPDNTLITPQSLHEVCAGIGIHRKMRFCDVSNCGSARLDFLCQRLEDAKQAFTSNHLSYAIDHGDVDLFRADDEIQRLEQELRVAAVNLKKYQLELSEAVEAVEQNLFFNGNAMMLSTFVDQEMQEQVIVARKERQEARRVRMRRAAALLKSFDQHQQKIAAVAAAAAAAAASTASGSPVVVVGGTKKVRSKNTDVVAASLLVLDDDDEEDRKTKSNLEAIAAIVGKPSSWVADPSSGGDAASDETKRIQDEYEQLLREDRRKKKLERRAQRHAEKAARNNDNEQDGTISSSSSSSSSSDEDEDNMNGDETLQQLQKRLKRKKFKLLRQYRYQEIGEPIPGSYFAEPAVITHLDLSRPIELLRKRTNNTNNSSLSLVVRKSTPASILQNSSSVSSTTLNNNPSQRPSSPSSSSANATTTTAATAKQLEDYYFDDKAVKILCRYLADNDTVISLSLANQSLTALTSMALAEMLRANYTLQDIDLHGNTLMDSVAHLCDALVTNHSVCSINVLDNGTSDVLLHRVATLCSANVEPLKFKDILMTIFEHRAEPRAIDLAFDEREQLRKPHMLQEYPNKKDRVDDVSAEMLCTCGLQKCVSVRFLDASETNISDLGAEHLIKVLTETRTIVTLHLRNVRLTDKAGEVIARAWMDIPTLYEVDLSYNKGITDLTVHRAIESACQTFKCTQFLVDGCCGSEEEEEDDAEQRSNQKRKIKTATSSSSSSSASLKDKLYILCRVNGLFGKADERLELVECVMNVPSRQSVAFDSLAARGLMVTTANTTTTTTTTTSNSNSNAAASGLLGTTLEVICTCVPMSEHVTELSLEYDDLHDDALPLLVSCITKCPKLSSLSLAGNKLVDVSPLCLAMAPWMNEDDEELLEYMAKNNAAPLGGVTKKSLEQQKAKKKGEPQQQQQQEEEQQHQKQQFPSTPRGTAKTPEPESPFVSFGFVDDGGQDLNNSRKQTHHQQQRQQQAAAAPLGSPLVPLRVQRRRASAAAFAAEVAASSNNNNNKGDNNDGQQNGDDPDHILLRQQDAKNTIKQRKRQQDQQQQHHSSSCSSTATTTPTSMKKAGGGGKNVKQAVVLRPEYPSRITKLDLNSNRLSVASAFSIADLLRSSDQLQDLNVSNNPWGRLGARVIASSILVNGGLKHILIASEGVPASLVAQAESALQCNLMDSGAHVSANAAF